MITNDIFGLLRLDLEDTSCVLFLFKECHFGVLFLV
jgi:hypothetical protein